MNFHHFTAKVPLEIGAALGRFEKEFTYPLGTQARFRISHGEDYLPFFQAMGEPDLTVIEEHGEILGCLARVSRRLVLNGESSLDAHYLCDLKLRIASRGTTALPRLIREAKSVIESSNSRSCYCVVMGGTGRLPTDYTGRLGVPRFEKIGDIAVLRLESLATSCPACKVVSQDVFEEVARGLPRSGYSALGADRFARSVVEPIHLVTENGDACGIIEDTRKGKRLFAEGGDEMLSGHLSRFSFATPAAAGRLLRDAASLARGVGLPALFTALPASKADAVIGELQDLQTTVAPAGIYGHALEAGHDWWVDTAEI
jgi:hypothetical protein